MAQGDVLFREHGIMPVAHFDLLQVQTSGPVPRTVEGQVAWMRDSFGKLRLFTYRNNIKGSGTAFTAGELASRKLEIETNITAGSTTTATGTFTANDHVGARLVVHDDAGGAGAAPEGESTIVASNTATVLTFESSLPLSTALAVNDDLTIFSHKVIAAADGDYDFVVCGIAMGAVPDAGWGWFQFAGYHPAANHKNNTAVTAGDPIVADAGTVGPWGSDVANLWVGRQVGTQGADLASTGDRSAVVMALLPVYN